MDGTYAVVMGDRGRLVIPADLRERHDLRPGSTLFLTETPDGIVMLTRHELRKMVREDLHGVDLVGELLAERRAAAARDDTG